MQPSLQQGNAPISSLLSRAHRHVLHEVDKQLERKHRQDGRVRLVAYGVQEQDGLDLVLDVARPFRVPRHCPSLCDKEIYEQKLGKCTCNPLRELDFPVAMHYGYHVDVRKIITNIRFIVFGYYESNHHVSLLSTLIVPSKIIGTLEILPCFLAPANRDDEMVARVHECCTPVATWNIEGMEYPHK